MDLGLPASARVPLPEAFYETLALDEPSLGEYRSQLFALLSAFQKAVARPQGHDDAIVLLGAIVQYCRAYFSFVEFSLRTHSPLGAARHRQHHREILAGMKLTLQQCSEAPGEDADAALAHAVDSVLMYEMTLRHTAPRR